MINSPVFVLRNILSSGFIYIYIYSGFEYILYSVMKFFSIKIL